MMNTNFFQTLPHITLTTQPQVAPVQGLQQLIAQPEQGIQHLIAQPKHQIVLGVAPQGHALEALLAAALDLPFAGDLTLAGLEDAKEPDRSTQDLHDEPYVRPPPA